MSVMENRSSRGRVSRHTSAGAQERIDDQTRRNIRFYATQPRGVRDARIAELERERDIEQVLETNAGLLAFGGAVMGTTLSKKFFVLTGAVLGFLTQHALSGWCPPIPMFRRLGIRTRAEIDQERFALKALRGDFRRVRSAPARAAVSRVLSAVQAEI